MNPMEELRRAIAIRMDEIIQEEIEAAKVRTNKRMAEAVAALSLEFCQWYNVRELHDEIVITVRKPEVKS